MDLIITNSTGQHNGDFFTFFKQEKGFRNYSNTPDQKNNVKLMISEGAGIRSGEVSGSESRTLQTSPKRKAFISKHGMMTPISKVRKYGGSYSDSRVVSRPKIIDSSILSFAKATKSSVTTKLDDNDKENIFESPSKKTRTKIAADDELKQLLAKNTRLMMEISHNQEKILKYLKSDNSLQ